MLFAQRFVAFLCLLATNTALAVDGDAAAHQPVWLDDYAAATVAAEEQGKMLLVHFVDSQSYSAASEALEQRIANNSELQAKLADWLLVRVPANEQIMIDGQPTQVLKHSAFAEMHQSAGIAVIDYLHEGAAYHGKVVSAFPFRSGKYYRWNTDYLELLPDLPAGTLTQRSMVWAVREHDERPLSTSGGFSPEIAGAAAEHSRYQARIRVQGHQRWGNRSQRLQSMIGLRRTAEVVAESWPNQTMIDSCLDCVASWRHSSGHWGQVKRPHRLYGYDLRRGSNGIWYGTGIFAD